jgi:hypothetical protein
VPTREEIIAEIQRTAAANGGKPLGRSRFTAETGIREHDWRGRYWARWNEAVEEAGYSPNVLQGAYDPQVLLDALVSEIRQLGKMPTNAELRLRRRVNPDFPDAKVFDRLGPKATWAGQVAAYCAGRTDCADVLATIAPLIDASGDADERGDNSEGESAEFGFVYLLKSGRFYKIGRTNSTGRRTYDLAIQLPEPVTLIHEIRTDDPVGIERYWHGRFGDRRKNGEWFELAAADVAAFRRRRFM